MSTRVAFGMADVWCGGAQEAFTHPTVMCEQALAESYQRLEFLGDAVLDLMVRKECTLMRLIASSSAARLSLCTAAGAHF